MSKRKRYAAEEIISKLREAEVHLAQAPEATAEPLTPGRLAPVPALT